MHEAQLHERNSFITLTYNDESLATRRPTWEPTVPYTPPSESTVAQPNDQTRTDETPAHADSLIKRDVQLFVKRLRKDQDARGLAKIRYYLVGEYGDQTKRPHYHAAIFGEDFTDDRTEWRTSGDNRLYRSSRLEKIWGMGHCEIGALTFESAAYVARYIMKKVNGDLAAEHYKRTDLTTGEVYWITPEFSLMSRGGRKNTGGIGKEWFDKWGRDVYPHDFVVMKNQKLKPPRYYDQLLAKIDAEGAALIKLERQFNALSQAADNTPKRLRAKEIVATAKLNQGKRQL